MGTYLNQIVPLQIAAGIETAVAIIPAEQRAQVAAIPDSHVIAVEGLGRGPRALARLSDALRSAAARLRPDIVHAHSSFAGLITRTARLPAPRPAIVYCPHGWAFDRDGNPAVRRLYALTERWLSRRSDAIVAISAYEQRRGIEIGIDPSRIRLVMNGLADLPLPPGEMPDDSDAPLRLLFVGRLDRQKGFDLLLRAVERLGAGVDLRVAGVAVVGAEGAPASLPDNVHLLGWLDEAAITQELASCDVLVLPSRWEGFGLVAVEAMRAARAVAASRIGGLPEVVLDGETGVLFAPGDVDELVEALRSRPRRAWRDLGANGRRRFLDRFTAARTTDALFTLYEDCLAARQSPAATGAR